MEISSCSFLSQYYNVHVNVYFTFKITITFSILLHVLFQKYFTDGEKLADETLLEVVSDAGLSKDNFLDYVTNPDNLEKVVTKAARWSAKGISGKTQ